ncbi:MAG: ACP S-malonyltransferase [Rickettsiaceae bacterium]
MNRAFIFPGQGSQSIGMGKDFFNSEPIAKQIFQTVDKSLGYDLSDIIFHGQNENLSITTNTQPAIMATSVAIFRVLLAKLNKNIQEICSVVAGHSLGEYSALCAAGVIDVETAAKLLKIRARSMQEASPQGQGAMAACIGITHSELLAILQATIEEGVCQIANDNVEGQIVISGHEYNVDLLIAILKDGGYRAIKLNVSAPFHSDLIKTAEIPMKEALEKADFVKPQVPIISNVTVNVETNIDQIKTNLLSQICSTVRWRETMDQFAKIGITELVEIGPARVLSGLAKKSPHNFVIHNIATVQDMENYLMTF